MDYTVTKNGNECVIKINGPLKASGQGDFKTLLAEYTATGASKCRIDLSQVDHIDSTGLGLLLMLQDSAKKANGSVILANPQEAARHAFELARFDELFTME